jgi:alkanesulfonate monooxygenase SsuD/methylene tetrahydromethanopterin reductase-like flavin-dependent oxidoreductase (luciferase family)
MIGTGVGWNEEEFTNCTRQPWGKRYGVMRETVMATRALWRDEEPEFHGDYIDFDPVWCNPKPAQAGGPPVIFGAMGPLGVKHAAQWADGWMPVDVAMGDVQEGLRAFRQQVAENGRNPDAVPVTLQTLITPDLDTLKRYRDLGVERVVIGVAVDMWDQPEKIMPMIDTFAGLIPQINA